MENRVSDLFVAGFEHVYYRRTHTEIIGALKHTSLDPLEFKDRFNFDGYDGTNGVYVHVDKDKKITVKMTVNVDEGMSSKEAVARTLAGRRYYENHEQAQSSAGNL
jgi:hypothetical protein